MKRPTQKALHETVELAAARIEQIEHELKRWAAQPVEFDFDPTGSHLFSMMELLHSFAKRYTELAVGIRAELEQDRIVAATILGRALIETIAMGCLFADDMNRFIEAKDVENLDKRFLRYYTGVKGKDVQPVHVMDAIRHLEVIDGQYAAYLDQKYGVLSKFLETQKKLHPGKEDLTVKEVLSAKKNYDDLSEVSHPNGLGTQFLFPDDSNENAMSENVRLRFRTSAMGAIWQGHHLLVALEKCKDLPNRYRIAFMKPGH